MECWMLHQWLSHFLPLLSRSRHWGDQRAHRVRMRQYILQSGITTVNIFEQGLYAKPFWAYFAHVLSYFHEQSIWWMFITPILQMRKVSQRSEQSSVTQLLVELGFKLTFQDSTTLSFPTVLCGLSRILSILEDGWQGEGSWEWILQGSLWDLKFRKMIGLPIRQQWKLLSPTVPYRKSGGSQGHRLNVTTSLP